MGEIINSRKGRFKEWVVSSKAAMSMLLVQIFATFMLLLSKIVLNNGTFVFALMTYRHLVAALCVAPFVFFFERGIRRYMRWSLFLWLFLNAFTGITAAMGLYYYGIRDTTATYAANFLNLIPIFTFLFSIITRIETLGLRSRAGKIKTFGAILCVGGALTTGLYKGKSFHIFNHFHSHESHHHAQIMKLTTTHWTRGSFMLVGSCFCYATWYILQVKVMKVLQLKYWATMLTCGMAAMQCAVLGLCIDRRKEVWRLRWDLQLLTIFYSGALATAATFCLISWTVAKQGPTYPSMFNPLSLIFVAILESLLLGADITFGALAGMLMIIVGLYSFLLGKRKAMKGSINQRVCLDLEVVEVAVAPIGDSAVTITETYFTDDNVANDRNGAEHTAQNP